MSSAEVTPDRLDWSAPPTDPGHLVKRGRSSPWPCVPHQIDGCDPCRLSLRAVALRGSLAESSSATPLLLAPPQPGHRAQWPTTPPLPSISEHARPPYQRALGSAAEYRPHPPPGQSTILHYLLRDGPKSVAFRHFPLRKVHPHAQHAAEVAEAQAAAEPATNPRIPRVRW